MVYDLDAIRVAYYGPSHRLWIQKSFFPKVHYYLNVVQALKHLAQIACTQHVVCVRITKQGCGSIFLRGCWIDVE